MNKSFTTSFLLLLTAMIWGMGFVAQSSAMDFVPPYLFNFLRFLLAVAFLTPLYLFAKKRKGSHNLSSEFLDKYKLIKSGATNSPYFAGLVLGIILFIASALQQVGIIYTSVANAGFITSLYIVIVPILGVFLGHKISIQIWLGIILASFGLYLLSIEDSLVLSKGDSLQLVGAFFWALHVVMIGYYSPRFDAIFLSLMQFATAGILSLLVAIGFEKIEISYIIQGWLPIFYAGVISTGVGFTLQIIAQKRAKPAQAAILLSTEALFAALGAWLILSETMTERKILGASLMFLAFILAQEIFKLNKNKHKKINN